MIRRYNRTRYVDTDTGEIMIGEAAYRRYLEGNGITKFSRRGERRTTVEEVDGVEYITTIQEFKIAGIMERLRFEKK